jgi:hypothetical protein
MSDLKQDLADVAEALPRLPGTVDGLHQEAQALGDAVADLAADLGAARGELDGALTTLAKQLDALRLQVEGIGQRLAEGGTRAESAWTAARESVLEASGRLEAGAETLEDERLAQEREAEDSASRARIAWDLAPATERLGSEGREGAEKVEAGVEASRDHAEALRATVGEALAAAEEAADSLHQDLEDGAEAARGQAVLLAGETMSRQIGAHQSDLQSVAGQVAAHAEALRDEAEEALRAVLEPLTAACDGAVGTLLAFTAEEALTSREGAEAVSLEDQRGKLQGTLQLLTDEAANLPAVMHQVEISAQLTGLP